MQHFSKFDELFAGESYIGQGWNKKNNFDNISQFLFLFHTGRFKKIVDKLISVLLDAVWQPENIDGEN